ncbi:MAG: DNA internalization-related competence protein ComEC/Rec2 [Gemmatimonadaceae bacterium]
MPLSFVAGAAWVIGLLLARAGVPVAWGAPLACVGSAWAAAMGRGRTVAPVLVLVLCAMSLGESAGLGDGRPPPRATSRTEPVELTDGVAAATRAATEAATGAATAAALEGWRRATAARLERLFGADAGIVRALLIAETDGLTPALRDRYADAGLVHLLSISGLHVAIVGAALTLAFRAMRLSRRAADAAAVAVAVLYVAAIGAPAPAVRSVVLFAVMALARGRQRPVHPWGSFALGAIAPVALDPAVVGDLGWQLSVTGYAALVAVGRFVRRRADEAEAPMAPLARELLTGTVATIVSAPLVAWHFGRLSLIGPFANVVAAPIVSVLQPTLFLAMVLPERGGAPIAAAAARPLLHALDGVAIAASAPSWARLTVVPSLAVAALAGAASVSLLVAVWSARPRAPMLAGALCLAAMPWWPVRGPRLDGRPAMEVQLLDVGQGDAIAVRTPRGRWILLDAGRAWRGGDAGRRTILPALRRDGGALALLILTHPHADHIGGATSVIRALRPAQVRDGGFVAAQGAYRDALEAVAARGARWARVQPGEVLTIDGILCTFLAPDSAWAAGLGDPNSASAVVRLQFGAARLLLTGDAEADEEAWLLDRYAPADLRADVLKVAHHGSTTSSTAAFLDAVRPRVALVSVGATNRYGHPAPPVMRRLLERGTTVLRTDQLGAVRLRTDGRRWEARVAGRRWTITPPLPAPAPPGEVSR